MTAGRQSGEGARSVSKCGLVLQHNLNNPPTDDDYYFPVFVVVPSFPFTVCGVCACLECVAMFVDDCDCVVSIECSRIPNSKLIDGQTVSQEDAHDDKTLCRAAPEFLRKTITGW